jgi:Amt family ammonium transporter
VSPLGAIAIGAIAAPLSYFAILWRSRTALDDSLDVVAAHGVGGATGALLTGVFAQADWGGSSGLISGNARQVGVQLIGLLVVGAYSGVATLALVKLVNAVGRVRSTQRDEAVGLDITQHGEEAYTRGDGAVLVMPSVSSTAARSSDESMRVPLEVPA